jgi:hypothetical protein
MSGVTSFADIIRAVTDGWGLLALALLLLGLLAIQMTKGASPNVRVATFLVIFVSFLGALYMTFSTNTAGRAAIAEADVPDAKDIDAEASAAAEYRQSVDEAYGNAASKMGDVASRIAGEEPAASPSAGAKD